MERRFFVRWRRRKLAFERMPPCKKLVPMARLPRLIALGNSEMCKGASATAQISVPAPKHIIPPCTKEPEIHLPTGGGFHLIVLGVGWEGQAKLPRFPGGYAPWRCQWLVGREGECRVGPERYSSKSVILAGVKSGFERSWIIRWTSSVFCVASIELC